MPPLPNSGSSFPQFQPTSSFAIPGFVPSMPGQWASGTAGNYTHNRYVPWRVAKWAEQASNEEDTIFSQIMQSLQGQGQAAMADNALSGRRERGGILNSAISRGLGNTTVLDSLNNRSFEREGREQSRIQEGVGRQLAGAWTDRANRRQQLYNNLYQWVIDNETRKGNKKSGLQQALGGIAGAGASSILGGINWGNMFGGGGSFMDAGTQTGGGYYA